MWKLKKTPLERAKANFHDALKIDAFLKREAEKIIHEYTTASENKPRNWEGVQKHCVYRMERCKFKMKKTEKFIADVLKEILRLEPSFLAQPTGSNVEHVPVCQ